MPEISREEVAHLAQLSQLALQPEEIEQFSSQIDQIVAHVSAVRSVDTEGVEPMSHPQSISTAMRADVVRPSLSAEQAIDQAPKAENDQFVVPQILGEE
ncbi:glutamyl-tRNA amidotransferase [Corynebacterium atypicum]|uniref:Aspartyl/glutamyl-tRNA(Asn/Gln) amidotransferase subunit C n=1 Tax=Corynebacterium atypicum TaxID=191610 RepID=A0ABM5QND7_9CORY|nr:Asp-tRNA(Asn)/Glu-tRNA(Gln) amidotransferase subunit GatC [Corynebacterium atypicum]AIG64272.1 glutamyl-tRNA amidotransferase [Corynebacterium atypicum]